MRYPTYDIGEHVYAWSHYLNPAGGWQPVWGKVIQDDGERELYIKPDKDSAFAQYERLLVQKDRIF